jgi:hypothetical protein
LERDFECTYIAEQIGLQRSFQLRKQAGNMLLLCFRFSQNRGLRRQQGGKAVASLLPLRFF